MINWKVSKEDARTIAKIVDRAEVLAKKCGAYFNRLNTDMDLTACHANGNPIDFGKLLSADDFNFGHDVFGITRHINRETGQLENCFSPRYSKT